MIYKFTFQPISVLGLCSTHPCLFVTYFTFLISSLSFFWRHSFAFGTHYTQRKPSPEPEPHCGIHVVLCRHGVDCSRLRPVHARWIASPIFRGIFSKSVLALGILFSFSAPFLILFSPRAQMVSPTPVFCIFDFYSPFDPFCASRVF